MFTYSTTDLVHRLYIGKTVMPYATRSGCLDARMSRLRPQRNKRQYCARVTLVVVAAGTSVGLHAAELDRWIKCTGEVFSTNCKGDHYLCPTTGTYGPSSSVYIYIWNASANNLVRYNESDQTLGLVNRDPISGHQDISVTSETIKWDVFSSKPHVPWVLRPNWRALGCIQS